MMLNLIRLFVVSGFFYAHGVQMKYVSKLTDARRMIAWKGEK